MMSSSKGACYFCDLILEAQRNFLTDHPDRADPEADEGPCELCFLHVAIDAFVGGIANRAQLCPIPVCKEHLDPLMHRLIEVSNQVKEPLPVMTRAPMSREELGGEKERPS